MQCLVAIEPDNLKQVLRGLRCFYPDIKFKGCSNADELFALGKDRPDIVVISRFLPGGSDYRKFIPEIPLFFALSHVVLLVGNTNEEGRTYIRLAEDNGLYNHVTGVLPGNRPYTLMVALTQDKAGNKIEAQDRGVPEPIPPEPKPQLEPTVETANSPRLIEPEEGGKQFFEIPSAETSPTKESPMPPPPPPPHAVPEPIPQPAAQRRPAKEPEFGLEQFEQVATPIPPPQPAQEPLPPPVPQPRPEPPAPQPVMEPAVEEGQSNVEPLFIKDDQIDKGLLVLTTANKGGVGKTTAATTLAIALANVGIDVAIADLDLEGPNVSRFFNLNPSKGIEFLANRQHGLQHLIDEILLSCDKYPGLQVLPGIVSRTVFPDSLFEAYQMNNVIDALRQTASVVIVDTPPGFWVKPWLPEVFKSADIILSIVDQSVFSKQDATDYAPYLLSMGVMPNKIKIVLNRFSPKLHNARRIEDAFCSGFKQNVPAKDLPRIIATIPSDWNAHGLSGYKSEAVGLEDPRSQWHTVAEDIAVAAGFRYKNPKQQKKRRGLGSLLRLGRLFK